MVGHIAAERLANQRLERPASRDAEDVVAWLGAVQAQDFAAAKWALAIRMSRDVTAADIDRCFNDGRVLRTHVMRPTWHFVSASDITWMLEVTAPRVQRAMASVYRQYGLDNAIRVRGTRAIERALRDGEHLTRAELGAHLARAGIAVRGVPLALLTVNAELERVICSGSLRGTQSTYALLTTRALRSKRFSRDEAIAELATRYFRSHGPATIRDFVWWSGLVTADAKRGLESIGARQETIGAHTYWTVCRTRTRSRAGAIAHLLPVWDEYLVAYRDLDAVPRAKGPGGSLQPSVAIGGEVAGTWRAVRSQREVIVQVTALKRLRAPERAALAAAAKHYGRFLGAPASLVLTVDTKGR